ncbi:MAG: DUF4398 domain-containing protein [Deltaproteobacteria bacterium]|nr:MAG: DUF4398 domain-containing protein [Deltaproteobacteria bacterium]
MRFLVFATLLSSVACSAPYRDAYEALTAAQQEYQTFKETEHPDPDAVVPAIRNFTKATRAYEDGEYEQAIEYAEQTTRYLENLRRTIHTRKKVDGPPKELIEGTKAVLAKIEEYLAPNLKLEAYYDKIVEETEKGNYDLAMQYLEEAKRFIKTNPRLQLTNTVILDASQAYVDKYGATIPIYANVSESGELTDKIGEVKAGTEMIFLRSRRIDKNLRYIEVSSQNRRLSGWVYPDFVRVVE